MSRQKRKYLRKNVEFPLLVRAWASANPLAGDPSEHTFLVRDFGVGGLGFDSPVQLSPDDLIKIEFTLPGEQRRMVLDARVRACNPFLDRLRGIRVFRVGVKFVNLAEETQTYFINYMSGTFLLY
ncbi:MAG TPA: PilZ domain-containing protein [Bdellovibrionota bacterium]|nr:PilZ domain-containing protein [Bdellovibrionota bacterium]